MHLSEADGCRAVLFATKADETTLVNDCIIEKNTYIRYDFTAQTATAEGITNCEIRLYGTDGRVLTSPRFTMVVDARVVYDSDVTISESESNAIDAFLLRGAAIEEAIASVNEVKDRATTAAESVERILAEISFAEEEAY